MRIADLLRENREAAGLSQEALAKKLSIPLYMVMYLENPDTENQALVDALAVALGTTPGALTGKEPSLAKRKAEKESRKQAEEEQKKADALKKTQAKFPAIRSFLLDPAQCKNPADAADLFDGGPLPAIERNIILYLARTALFNFSDTNSSIFSFDDYLFALHSALFAKFEKELSSLDVSAEERDETLSGARSDIFLCDNVENIALMIFDDFSQQLNDLLAQDKRANLTEDLNLPLLWKLDTGSRKVSILDESGEQTDHIQLM
jgi:transcriptional regulator with XRE-family HTH domain